MAIDIDNANKDELATYALGEFGVELAKHKKLDSLRVEVKALINKRTAVEEAPAKLKPAHSMFLKNPNTGTVLEATDLLRQMPHLLPCDAEGNTA